MGIFKVFLYSKPLEWVLAYIKYILNYFVLIQQWHKLAYPQTLLLIRISTLTRNKNVAYMIMHSSHVCKYINLCYFSMFTCPRCGRSIITSWFGCFSAKCCSMTSHWTTALHTLHLISKSSSSSRSWLVEGPACEDAWLTSAWKSREKQVILS